MMGKINNDILCVNVQCVNKADFFSAYIMLYVLKKLVQYFNKPCVTYLWTRSMLRNWFRLLTWAWLYWVPMKSCKYIPWYILTCSYWKHYCHFVVHLKMVSDDECFPFFIKNIIYFWSNHILFPIKSHFLLIKPHFLLIKPHFLLIKPYCVSDQISFYFWSNHIL